jgi:hypothetical protein
MIHLKVIISSVFLVIILLPDQGHAQDFEEWKKNYLAEFREFKSKYDAQFYKELNEDWSSVDIDKSADPYADDKPEKIPVADKPPLTIDYILPDIFTNPRGMLMVDPTAETTESTRQDVERTTEPNLPTSPVEEPPAPITEPTSSAETENNEPEEEPTAPEKSVGYDLGNAAVSSNSFVYYGLPVQYRYLNAFKTRLEKPINKKSIAAYWKHMSSIDYPIFLNQMNELKDELALNDYGYTQLLKNMGDQIYGAGTNESTMFVWFMLTQAEFDTRLGYNQNQVHLLAKTSPRLYNTTFFTLNNVRYYTVPLSGSEKNVPSQLYTYNGSYPESDNKPLRLATNGISGFPPNMQSKELSFTYKDSTYKIAVPINRSVIDFYQNYPTSDLSLYFSNRMDTATHNALMEALQPIVAQKSNIQKVNILLRFVQTAFDYQVDDEQFGYEKYMFPEETIFYPASDCEDRASLFAYLIRHLTDLQYIGLRFPTHLAVGVHFPSQQAGGSYYMYKGRDYHIADPTYIRANVGMLMPDLRGQSAEILELGQTLD